MFIVILIEYNLNSGCNTSSDWLKIICPSAHRHSFGN